MKACFDRTFYFGKEIPCATKPGSFLMETWTVGELEEGKRGAGLCLPPTKSNTEQELYDVSNSLVSV